MSTRGLKARDKIDMYTDVDKGDYFEVMMKEDKEPHSEILYPGWSLPFSRIGVTLIHPLSMPSFKATHNPSHDCT